MLSLQTAVPVDAGIVEAELAVLLVNSNVGVVVAGEKFKGKGTKFRMRANIFDLVDDRVDALVLVFKDFGDEVFIGKILFAEVQVDWLLAFHSNGLKFSVPEDG